MSISRGLMALSSAAVLAALLCTPVSANEPSAKSADQAMAELSSASPSKARRVSARKRIVVASRETRAIMRQDVSWFRPHYERVVVAHWPIMLGIGF